MEGKARGAYKQIVRRAKKPELRGPIKNNLINKACDAFLRRRGIK